MNANSPYVYGLLLNDSSSEADEHNSKWLGVNTLGIEVTSQRFIPQCGLGNVDPQHTGEGSSAIEESLIMDLPPIGTKFVTIRSDKDSIGAMAVLTLRRLGLGDKINKMLVSWVGALDRLGYSEAAKLFPDLEAMFQPTYDSTALDTICRDFERWPELSLKVFEVMDILTGSMPPAEVMEIAKSRKRLSQKFSPETHGPNGEVAFIVAPREYDAARQWGSRYYPVTVVFDPEYGRTGVPECARYTIIQQTGKLDILSLRVAINTEEASLRGLSLTELKERGFDWGGNPNILSSPQGRGRNPAISQEAVLKNVIRCLQ